MAYHSNWRKWLGIEQKKPVTISARTHARIVAIADDTGLGIGFWADIGLKFFLAHSAKEKLIANAKGFTLLEYKAREDALSDMVQTLLDETDTTVIYNKTLQKDDLKPATVPGFEPTPAAEAKVNGATPAKPAKPASKRAVQAARMASPAH